MTHEEAELYKKEMRDSLCELNRLKERQYATESSWINDLLERSDRAVKHAQKVIRLIPTGEAK